MTSTPKPEPVRIIGPIPFKIKLADGSEHILTVRQLDVIELYEFIEFSTSSKTPDLVAMVIDRPKDFLRQIDTRTYAKLAAKCIEVNFDGAMELMADPIAASMLIPLMARIQKGSEMAEALGKTLKPSASERAPSESAAATGAASSETPSTG
jgi:hypothetical protein